ncbi:MAG: metallopeptidase TldD-related protein [Eubacteriales bacterium]|nr:metallopeptidase TldD-related protein [Eubacteriales bacterium]
MMREKYQNRETEMALNVVNGAINSVRTNNILKTGCRIFQDNTIGVAGCFGEASEDTWQLAKKHIQNGISYPWPLTQGIRRERDKREEQLSDSEYLERAEQLLDILKKRFPYLIFSNKMRRAEVEMSLSNELDTMMVHKDRYYTVELIFKGIDSVNVIDDALIFVGRSFNPENIISTYAPVLEAFNNRVKLPEPGLYPVLTAYTNFSGKFESDLNGRLIGSGGSFFSSKAGAKLFADNFSLVIDRSDESVLPANSFFDFEGSLLPNDRYFLIENGIVHSGYADRRTASDFNIPATAAAGGEYDDVPAISSPGMIPGFTHSSVSGLLKEADGPVIMIGMMDGGDFTDEGIFASPVQSAYLIEEGRIIGRLPELRLRGSITDLFGKNYIGTSPELLLNGNVTTMLRAEISEA